MAQVDFYILPYDNLEQSYQYLCRLIEKAYLRKHQVYVFASNRQEAHHVDEMLWTFKDNSFIPHNLLGEGPNQAPPVQLGFEDPGAKHRDILINITTTIPEFHQRFNRILEVVPDMPERQSACREHFSYYKEQGYTVNSHDISKLKTQA